jgi:SRSO17 transposase
MGVLTASSGDLQMTADQVRSLQPRLAALLESFRGCFQFEPTFHHLQTYVLGLLTDLKRKSVEPIALAAGVAVRTLQEFLSQLAWDHGRCHAQLQRLVMDRHGCEEAIGVITQAVVTRRPLNPRVYSQAAVAYSSFGLVSAM